MILSLVLTYRQEGQYLKAEVLELEQLMANTSIRQFIYFRMSINQSVSVNSAPPSSSSFPSLHSDSMETLRKSVAKRPKTIITADTAIEMLVFFP